MLEKSQPTNLATKFLTHIESFLKLTIITLVKINLQREKSFLGELNKVFKKHFSLFNYFSCHCHVIEMAIE
jgi:hypothetical protein